MEPEPAMSKDSTVKTERLSGVVVYLTENAGSKSEALLPHLYSGRERPLVVLMRRDDNPFENNGLAPYDGKSVTVVGERNQNGVFVVDEVTENISTNHEENDHEDMSEVQQPGQ